MKRSGEILILLAAGLVTSGCAYIGPTNDAKQMDRYEEYAPKFTDDEKTNMSVDEKLAIYNANVAIEQQLSCKSGEITGSHFRVFRCFTNDELMAQQNAAEEFMRAAKRGSSF